jgi:hypothetical protein
MHVDNALTSACAVVFAVAGEYQIGLICTQPSGEIATSATEQADILPGWDALAEQLKTAPLTGNDGRPAHSSRIGA